jgi:hypothetical protein
VKSGKVAILARFDPSLFATGATGEVATTDEESRGIIDASHFLGKGTFVFDAQITGQIRMRTRSSTGSS